MTKYETHAGAPSRAMTFEKLLHHIREAQDQAALLGHIHKIESNPHDDLLGSGYLGISQLLDMIADKITKLATNRLN